MRQSPKGTFLTMQEFEPHRKQFELPNLNKEKEKRRIREMSAWERKKLMEMPDTIFHYRVGKQYVRIPVGLAGHMPSKFHREFDNPVVPIPRLIRKTLYEKQERTVSNLMKRPYGLMHASTAVGKTIMLLDIIGRLQRKTLIVVHSLGAMGQMLEDIKDELGVTVPYIGGVQKKRYKPTFDGITVLNIDSRDKIANPEQYGLIILDEADKYLQADSRREWIGSLCPEFMYALTGTIKLNGVHDGVFKIYYGPKTELIEKEYTPRYFQVSTDFQYRIESARKEFHELKDALYTDTSRNELILSTIKKTLKGRKGIVFCEFVEHSKLLSDSLRDFGLETYMIIGEISKEEREAIRQKIIRSPNSTVLVGSVRCIGRGFNIPELSVGYMTTAEKFEANIEQYVGRIVRKFPGKETCEWYDFTDTHQGMLYRQAQERARTAKKTFPGLKVQIYF